MTGILFVLALLLIAIGVILIICVVRARSRAERERQRRVLREGHSGKAKVSALRLVHIVQGTLGTMWTLDLTFQVLPPLGDGREVRRRVTLWEPDAAMLRNGASVDVAVARDDPAQVVMQLELNAHPEEMMRRRDNFFEPDQP